MLGVQNGGIGYDAVKKKVIRAVNTPYSGIESRIAAHQQQRGLGGIFGQLAGSGNHQSAGAMAHTSVAANPQAAAPTAAPTQQAPTQQGGFSYDPNTDPVYLKALERARANAQSASGDAMASLNKRGILDSTITSDRVAGIQQDAVAGVETDLMPQLMQQAYQRYQDQQQNAFRKGDLTGYYVSPEMQQQYDIVNQAKQEWANAKTPEEKIAAHQKADAARGVIAQMGGNSGLVGADVTAQQAGANQGKYGIETMAHQQQMYEQDPNNPVNQARIIANKIDQINLDNLPEQSKLELEQLKQQVAAGKIDLQTAEHNLKELSDPNSLTNKTRQLAFDQSSAKSNGVSGGGSVGGKSAGHSTVKNGGAKGAKSTVKSSGGVVNTKPSTQGVIKDMNQPRTAATMETYIIKHTPGGGTIQGPPDPSRLQNIENMILSNPNLSEADIIKLYKKFGIPLPE